VAYDKYIQRGALPSSKLGSRAPTAGRGLGAEGAFERFRLLAHLALVLNAVVPVRVVRLPTPKLAPPPSPAQLQPVRL